MPSWGKSFLYSLISTAWAIVWVLSGGLLILIAIYQLTVDIYALTYAIFMIIAGIIVIALPFDTAFFKYFSQLTNKVEIEWNYAFEKSASAFGKSFAWGLLIPASPYVFPAVIGGLGIKANYYKFLADVYTGEDSSGSTAWKAAGKMLAWFGLWFLIAYIIIAK